jgi:hypothetical protein
MKKYILMALAAPLFAQTAAPPLGKFSVRNVTCEMTALAAKNGVSYDCKQTATDGAVSDAGSGTIIISSPNTSQTATITVTTPAPAVSQPFPPDANTFVITVNRGGNGPLGTPVISVGISAHTVIQ